jgi:DNA-directed RNA polymerase subunit RPC12/RpoP
MKYRPAQVANTVGGAVAGDPMSAPVRDIRSAASVTLSATAPDGGLKDTTIKQPKTAAPGKIAVREPEEDVAKKPAVTVKRYPTRLHARCGTCGHQGQITAFIDKPLKLKCTKCGSRDAIVVTRDRMRGWSRRRIGK